MPILAIHCLQCRGTGYARNTNDHCPACAGTGMRYSDDTSSAQPHRFAQDHPTVTIPSEPQDHPAAD